MSMARPVRVLVLVGLAVWGIFMYQILKPVGVPQPRTRPVNLEWDPNLEPTDEPAGPLVRTSDRYAPGLKDSDRISATLLSLVRNSEVDEMVGSMVELERTWNHKFNYPWTFFSDVPFSEEFKKKTRAATKAQCNYELVPREHWDVPSWINMDMYEESMRMLAERKVQYAKLKSYHQMCRWNSGFFYKHPALQDVRYYWRVEPKVHFFCDVDYDVFRYMQDHNKTYGFTIALYDDPNSVISLWPETEKFMAQHPEHLHPKNALDWLTDRVRRPEHNRKTGGYSTCHFWSNFEIADMTFWRSEAYKDFFDHLDRAGGFFYERWGDAPVHTIGLGLLEDSSRFHWFRDIGYRHIPFFNCPNSAKCSGCVAGRLTDGDDDLYKEDCRPNYFKYVHMG